MIWRLAAVAVVLAAGLATWALWMTGSLIPYNAPSVCAGHACEATGASVILPNADRLDVQLRGPAPGIDYAPAGSPSNVVAR